MKKQNYFWRNNCFMYCDHKKKYVWLGLYILLPYNWSKILKWVYLINEQCKRNFKILWHIMCFGTKCKYTTTTTKSNTKTRSGAGNWTRDLPILKRMRYLEHSDSVNACFKNLMCVSSLFNCLIENASYVVL